MARDHGAAAEALGEIESAAEKLSEWLEANFVVVAAAVAALLLFAGLGAWFVSSQAGREAEASTALAKIRADYLSAMGVGPESIGVPELANPEAAAQIRSDYRGRFDEVADEYAGSVAGTLAALESAQLASEAVGPDAAIERLEAALDVAPSSDALRGLVLQRLAQAFEQSGSWSEAAARHEQAAALDDFPLRGWALADAARCRAEAGEHAEALALYERLEREMPGVDLPPHQRAQRDELRAEAEASAA